MRMWGVFFSQSCSKCPQNNLLSCLWRRIRHHSDFRQSKKKPKVEASLSIWLLRFVVGLARALSAVCDKKQWWFQFSIPIERNTRDLILTIRQNFNKQTPLFIVSLQELRSWWHNRIVLVKNLISDHCRVKQVLMRTAPCVLYLGRVSNCTLTLWSVINSVLGNETPEIINEGLGQKSHQARHTAAFWAVNYILSESPVCLLMFSTSTEVINKRKQNGGWLKQTCALQVAAFYR